MIRKIPPVSGTRETSCRDVLNVERSSWANYHRNHISRCHTLGLFSVVFDGRTGPYVCGSEHPFALGAVLDCDPGSGLGRGWG